MDLSQRPLSRAHNDAARRLLPPTRGSLLYFVRFLVPYKTLADYRVAICRVI